VIPARGGAPALHRLNASVLAFGGLLLLVVYGVARSVVGAEVKPFWHDEMCTWILANLPKASGIWGALEFSGDGQPPLFYLIERGASRLAANEHLSYRLPSIVGFSFTIVLIFLFVRKRCGNGGAIICAAIPFLTLVYDLYAIEARPYALLVALIALALVCYQHAPDVRWMVLMGLSFALAQAVHYYAVFAVFPFVVAELTLSVKESKIRIAVWLGLACTLISLALFFPLLWRQKLYYGDHFWALPTWSKAVGFYEWSLNYYAHRDLTDIVLSTLLLGVVVGLISRKLRTRLLADPLFHEYVLVVLLFGLPFVACAAAKLVHGALDDRYTLSAVLAYPLGAGYILRRSNRAVVILSAFLIFSALTIREVDFWRSPRGRVGELISPATVVETLVTAAGHPDLPVLLSDLTDYLPLLHYASPEWNKRFFAVVDLPQQIAYMKSDTVSKNLLGLQCCYPIRLEAFQDFSMAHPTFLMYSNGSYWDWWFFRLKHDGDAVSLVATQETFHVYLVTIKK
jgi:Dolichyl-phosphate-mannose-protein mannosyltransferase